MDFTITPASPDGINVNVDFWVEGWEELAVLMMSIATIEYEVDIICGEE